MKKHKTKHTQQEQEETTTLRASAADAATKVSTS